MIPNWPYQTNKVYLTPHNRAWTATNIPQNVLSMIWAQLEQDDLLDTVFPGMGDRSHDAVVAYLAKKTVQLFWAGHYIIGFGFIDSADGHDGARKGLFGFAFFRKFWGTVESRHALYLMLAYWFMALQIDVVFGITLRSNRLARNVAKKFRFTEVADIPRFLYCNGELADATLVMLDRQTFGPLFHEWHGSQLETMRKEGARGRKEWNQPEYAER